MIPTVRTPRLPIVLRPTITTRQAILHLNIRTDTATPVTGTDTHGRRTPVIMGKDIRDLRTPVIMDTGVRDPGNCGFLWKSRAGLDGQPCLPAEIRFLHHVFNSDVQYPHRVALSGIVDIQ
jgi:hypothetical protein